ncbi:enoyl-CoA hydratase, partial [Achromobacter xylosoxidans]
LAGLDTERLRRALAQREIAAYFQPQHCVSTGELRGAEMLARWVADDGAMIPPAAFLPAFEAAGLLEMAYTGEAISAQDALAWGLVSRVVPAADLLPTARTLAAKIAANPGGVMRMTKRLLREGQHSSLASLLELSASYQALAHKTAEHREAVTAFIEKRAPKF